MYTSPLNASRACLDVFERGPNDWNRSTLRAASFGLIPISLLRSFDDFLRITSTSVLVCVVKTGVEFFEVLGEVSKSKVFAGEITVSIELLDDLEVPKNTRFEGVVEWI